MIAFAFIGFVLFHQLRKSDWSATSIEIENGYFLLLALALVPLNWWMEWIKWEMIIRALNIRSTFTIRSQAFFAGIVTGMLTPNMLGNFLGRMYYFERKNRIGLIILTLFGNYAQFLASMFFGLLAFFFLDRNPFDLEMSDILPIFSGLVVIFFLMYFALEYLLPKWKFVKRIRSLFEENNMRLLRFNLLLVSFVRYLIFSIQFSLMLAVFGEELSITNMVWIWQAYLWVTIAPSLFLGKLAIRESISIWVLVGAGMAENSVFVASLSIWVMNLFLPSIISLIICKNRLKV